MKSPYVFISYSTEDQEYANKIYTFLTTNEINVWIASNNIKGSESSDYSYEITQAINECKAFVFILSKNSNDSSRCSNELSMALNAGKKIISYKLHDFKLSKSNTYFLQQAQWVDATISEEESFNELLDEVILAFEHKDIIKEKAKIKTASIAEQQIENLLKRAYFSLNEGDFDSAENFAESILNINMEYAEAYFVKLLCELKLKKPEKIKTFNGMIISYKNFQHALDFAEGEFLEKLSELNRENSRHFIYNAVKELIKKPFDYDMARMMLEQIEGYKDADKLLQNLTKLHDERLIELIFYSIYSPYFYNITYVKKDGQSLAEVEKLEQEERNNIKKEINEYYTKITESIPRILDDELRNTVKNDYETLVSLAMLFQDAKYDECLDRLSDKTLFSYIEESLVDGIIDLCKEAQKKKTERIEKEERRIKENEERAKREKKQTKDAIKSTILGWLIMIIVASIIGLIIYVVKQDKYDQAKALMSEHRYEEAMDLLHNLDHRDSSDLYFYSEDMIEGEYYNIIDKYSLTEFEIPEGVTEIKNYAFYKCTTLVSVTIPSSVTKIGEEAFYKCTSLKNVQIPDNVTSIGESAFSDCSNLEMITLGQNSKLKSIGEYAFLRCKKLLSIKIPNNVTVINESTFNSCESLKEVILHNKLVEIDAYAFRDCKSLIKVIIPKSVTTIGDQVFTGCTSLTIYCEAESKPSGWRWNYNYSDRPEVWGYTE